MKNSCLKNGGKKGKKKKNSVWRMATVPISSTVTEFFEQGVRAPDFHVFCFSERTHGQKRVLRLLQGIASWWVTGSNSWLPRLPPSFLLFQSSEIANTSNDVWSFWFKPGLFDSMAQYTARSVVSWSADPPPAWIRSSLIDYASYLLRENGAMGGGACASAKRSTSKISWCASLRTRAYCFTSASLQRNMIPTHNHAAETCANLVDITKCGKSVQIL